MAAGEGLDEAGGIFAALQRDGGQLQACNPALGAAFQRRNIFIRKTQAHRLVEKLGGLSGGKTQVHAAQLGQLPPGTQASQRQGRVLAGGNDQMQLRRRVLENKREGLVNRRRFDDVVVVEDEDRLAGELRNLIQQDGQNGLDVFLPRRFQSALHASSDVTFDGSQRGHQIRQKARQLVVALIQGKPGNMLARLRSLHPGAHQRGFPESGRRADKRQLAAQFRLQLLQQPRPRDQSLWWGGDVEFCGEDWRLHRYHPNIWNGSCQWQRSILNPRYHGL